tara:strand:+ start:239 stop:619 length:381 start_codon:yes stop_codon:yes gene_type:complete
MKLTKKLLKEMIQEELEAVMAEQENQADYSSHDAVKAAIEKGQIDVGNVFTFMLGNNVRKGAYAGKRKVASKEMPEDVTSVFFINRSGDVTSMRKKDYGGDDYFTAYRKKQDPIRVPAPKPFRSKE